MGTQREGEKGKQKVKMNRSKISLLLLCLVSAVVHVTVQDDLQAQIDQIKKKVAVVEDDVENLNDDLATEQEKTKKMEKTVKEEGGLLETVHTDLKKVQDDTAMLTRNFEQRKVESGEKIAAVQKQVEDQQKNVTKNTENLSVVDELRKTSEKMIKKVITVEEQFGDDHNETILLKKIVKQQGEDILKMEEELKAERNQVKSKLNLHYLLFLLLI